LHALLELQFSNEEWVEKNTSTDKKFKKNDKVNKKIMTKIE